ncbi:hypothetical protein ACOZDZ_32385 [Streptomyces griseoincarnatus]|nr:MULTISPECIES: hypothetical protein [unclassified Streptomyces]MBU5942386.1 hypothetical protein [Streptomyces sp. PAM3C]WPW19711.1 hypothetical protein UBV09_13745 [Streptomyces griseoincarnatus]
MTALHVAVDRHQCPGRLDRASVSNGRPVQRRSRSRDADTVMEAGAIRSR